MLFGGVKFLLLKKIKQNNITFNNYETFDIKDEKNLSVSKNFNNINLFFFNNKLINSCYINVNFFFRAGFKNKIWNLINYNIGWFLFNYVNKFLYSNIQLNNFFFLENLTLNVRSDLFTFSGFNVLVKHVRLSRKIRKYTKNKIRYRSFIITLKNRQVYGTILRLWNLIYLNINNSYRLKSYIMNNLIWNKLFIENDFDKDSDNNYIKDDINKDNDYINTPQQIQFQMFDDLIHRK